MPTHRQWIVETPVTTRANGTSDYEGRVKSYPASPFYNGELSDNGVKEQFIELVQGPTVNDGGHTFGEHNRDYINAPNFEEVETGGGGLPGAPWAPNVASPVVSDDPSTIPAEGAEVTLRARGGGGYGVGSGLDSPSDSSKNIAAQTIRIGSLKFGTSTPSGG